MDAHYETYTKIKEVDESNWDMNLKDLYRGLRSMAKGSEVTPSETLSMLRVFILLQRNERRQGGPVSRRTVDCHKLIRFSVMLFLASPRQFARNKKMTKRTCLYLTFDKCPYRL